ncbi:condensation domain-containing protein [Streptomyces sp. NPDC018045]|uniref:condensation domain-containing protein n=1 Tax=Streptomyces sp. NPDC018045 TaxID=3365037 RepID=UPI00379AB538
MNFPLSFNQEFICGFDRGDTEGPFGPRFHIVHGWRLRGSVDGPVLRAALGDVVARHEALRTVIARDEDPPHQRVLAPSPPALEERHLPGLGAADRARAVEDLLIEAETGAVSARRAPLLRAVLARFDDEDALLVLAVHHTAADGWSVRIVIRDIAECYAARRALGVPPRPVRQYREFAARQRADATGPHARRALDFWRDNLRGASAVSVPVDHPKSSGRPEATAIHRFAIGADVVAPALELGRAHRCTPFMVFMAAFKLFLHRREGVTDLVVPTFSPGREDEDFHRTVGLFFNYLPLRTDLSHCGSFRDVLERVRRSCLTAYAHDTPFMRVVGVADGLMDRTLEDGRAACVFQVFPFPHLLDGEQVGDVEYSEVRRRLRSQPIGSDVPNGALWTLNLDPAGDVVAAVQYNSNLFDESTIAEAARDYTRVLREVVRDPDAPPVRVSRGRVR